MATITKEKAIHQLWQLGELSWKLKGNQKKVYHHIVNNSKDIDCILICRRFGKSFINCLLAVETCLKTKNAIVKYACPEQKQVKTTIRPIMREIFKDAPPELNLADIWKEQDKVYRFPNGSEIQIAGTDKGNAENLRGGYANLCILDEAGFMTDLDYVVNSILLPTTDTTNGRLILTSTPNYKDPNHEFHEIFIMPFEAEGRLIKFTIYDSPMVDDAKRQKILERYPGGELNSKFRCEYLCEIPKNSELTVIPEFTKEMQEMLVTDKILMPSFYDSYVSMDVGFRDLTVALFGYYDFKNARLVILDELVMNGPEMTTDKLAIEIKHKEKLRFYDELSDEIQAPYLRVMDNDLKLINDLSVTHGISFIATEKDGKEAAVNTLRIWIHSKKVVIHPRCKHLIYHLSWAQWDKNRKEFKHLKDSIDKTIRGGHADALDALIYMVRNVMESKNPYPESYGKLHGEGVFKSMFKKEDSQIKSFVSAILNLKK